MSASPIDTEWSRDYRSFMRCDARDTWMPEVEAQLSGWLREKRIDIDLTQDGELDELHRQVVVRRNQQGDSDDLLVRMVEHTNAGTWTTELLAHDGSGERDWIYLSVSNDERRFVDVPRIAKYLMGVLPLGDGAIEFRDKPRHLRPDDVDDLVAVLADKDRHGPVFVAATDSSYGIPFDKFAEKVADWTRQIHGLGQVVVMDPHATDAFEDAVGGRFATQAWTLRTYLPGVDFSDPADSRRHRILGTKRLGSEPDRRIQRLLGEVARNHVAGRALPGEVRQVQRRFARLENRRLIAALESPELPLGIETKSAPELPLHLDQQVGTQKDQSKREPERGLIGRAKDQLAELTLVKQILKLEEITEVGLRDIAARLSRGRLHQEALQRFEDRVNELQARVEVLEDRNREALEALEDQQMERELALLEVDDRDAKIRWLEARLKEKGDYEASYLEVPEEFIEDRPASFDELLDRVEAMEGLEFTGDRGEAEKLNAIDTNDAALRVAWDAVLMMADYCKARTNGDCDGGLDFYINHTPTGYRTFPPGKWAATETGATMQGWGDERVFTVPKHVEPSGQIEMKAHFKLARIGMATPRMHIFDNHPAEPVVYIGYIGTHLTNTQTN